MRTTATLAAAVIAAGGALVSAQIGRPQTTFRSEINYVEVDVVVTDADGQFVPGLTAADFELTDDGAPQKIDAVHEINLPIERAVPAPGAAGLVAPPDVTANASAGEGRLFVLVLDDLHTTPFRTNHVRRRAREFVEQFVGPDDAVAVVYTSGRAGATQDFTSNHALVLDAIEKFAGRGLKAAVQNRMDDMQTRQGTQQAGRRSRDVDATERVNRARVAFDMIEQLSASLAPITGRRKALLWFSEGVDVDGVLAETQRTASELRRARADAIAAATRANVHVYPVDATGLTADLFRADIASIPTGARAEQEDLTTEALADEFRRAKATLRTFAEQTGGAALVESNDFAGGFARIQRDNSTYYLLGFYPSTVRDGKFHEIAVRVKRPGLRVRARAGYHAARPDATRENKSGAAPLADLMNAPLASPGLPMRMALAVFRQTRDEAVVLMAIDLPRDVFAFEPQGEAFAEDLHLVYQVIGTNAKVVASDGFDLEMRLRPDMRDLVEGRGFRAVFPLEVKPGRYQVRVAAQLKNAARRGSVFADLVVPDLFDDRLMWSGVALTSAAAAAVPTRPAGNSADLVPLMPSAIRAFAPDDTLALYAEAYDNDRRGAHVVDVTASVRDETGKVVFTTTEERTSAELNASAGGHRFRADIPLTGLPPGSYVLTLTARSRASGNATATRDIPFEIS